MNSFPLFTYEHWSRNTINKQLFFWKVVLSTKEILFCFWFCVFFEVEKNDTKDGHAKHHRKCRCIIRICRCDESFVLIVPQRTNWELRGGVKSCKTLPYIINSELEYAVDIWNFEFCCELSTVVNHCLPYKRINPVD